MKKYLMTGIAAIAMCAAFTSCSHDPGFEQLTPEQVVQANYEAAFINAFGQPAPNQDWGFGKYSYGVRTRAITPNDNKYTLTNQTASYPNAPAQPTFRSNPGAPTFSATVPTGTPEATSSTTLENDKTYQIKTGSLSYPQNYTNLTFYVVEDLTWNAQINSNGSNGTTFIITAGKTLTFNQTVANNLRIYMAPGSHLVIGNGVTFKKNGAMLYVGNGCTVTCGTTVNFGEEYTVLNECGTTGSFTANQLNIEEGTLFYNNSPLTVNTGILLNNMSNNKGGELINNSQITTPKIDVKAGGRMYNTENGTTDVSGKTYLYHTNSAWMNDGIYNSGDFEVDNIEKVWNNCKLTVHKADNTGEFKIAGNSYTAFVLNGNNSVQTDKMYWGNNADFYMKGYSLLEVLGECKSYNANKNHGLHGLDNSIYSIFKAASVTYNTKVQNCMNYYGNIYVDTENHFAQELLDKSNLNEASDQPLFYFNTTNRTVKFRFAPFKDACPIATAISSGKCYHGYTPPTTPNDPPTDNPPIDNPPSDYQGRIMAEDLTVKPNGAASDFDFNDVVFDWKIEGNVATIQLRAIGGTLPLTVGGQEVHDLFGVQRNVMVNTGVTTEAEPAPYTYTFPNGVEAIAKNIPIIVTRSDGTFELTAEMGKVASKINVPTSTKWVKEFKDIKEAYPDFEGWVANPTATWTSNYNSALLYNPL